MSIPESVVPPLAKALAERGFATLTPVQEAVLARELAGIDLVVSAQTGSGKTVAFGLALAGEVLAGQERLARPGAPVALVIAPTRELALQVQRELAWLYAPAGGLVASCVGGMDARDERRALERGAHIVVGTPGRLSDHIRRGALVLDSLQAVVLDEADEMLNLGFREELEFILEASPAARRTLMFSATMPRGIEALAKKYQNQAVRVNTVGAQKQHMDIDYRALVTASHDTENAIFNVLRYYDAINAIVFCGTREAVNRMTSRFANRGFSVVALSGELSQNERTHALQAMRDHRAQVCVATDVAARGIDLPDLELVIHADLPKNTEALLHRSGRTGRAGRKGASILIVPSKSRRRVERLLQDAQVRAQWGAPPSADDVKQRDDERLLGDPLLQEPAQERETGLIKALLARHSSEQIAAAFVRLHRKGMAAPEDLEPPPPERPDRPVRAERGERPERREWQERPERGERAMRPPRDNFAQGVWISLSVGRAQSAEARWLLPMLCKATGLTKRDIGAIRIGERETYVEIEPDSADSFFESIGPGGMLEKSIRVARLDRAPESGGGAPRKGPSKPPPRRAGGDGPPDGERPRRAPAPKPPYVSKRKSAPATAKGPADGGPPRKKKKWLPDA